MDFIADYLKYTKETEPPIVYHRWCAISAIGALLGRSSYINLGHFRVFPNLYTMLIGEPGARKSTAIKINKRLLTASGYTYIGADKTTQEKFLIDLEGIEDDPSGSDSSRIHSSYSTSITAKNLWGDIEEYQEPKEVFIMADEFNEFAGAGNVDFYSLLGNFWDWDDPKPYTRRLKNSRSVSIFQPTISILGGNTTENFSRAFPPEIIGQGFLSRLILIYGEKSIRKYARPTSPSAEATASIVSSLLTIRKFARSEVVLDTEADAICDAIYDKWPATEDHRFKGYDSRRYTQLLKLSLILSAARGEDIIIGERIIEANTILAAADVNMPKALGEFGMSKTSEIADKILNFLDSQRKAVTLKDIWAHVRRDLEKMEQLASIMQGLLSANKVQFINTHGYLTKKKVTRELEFVDFNRYLTQEERNML